MLESQIQNAKFVLKVEIKTYFPFVGFFNSGSICLTL